jgi:hypothetical protein
MINDKDYLDFTLITSKADFSGDSLSTETGNSELTIEINDELSVEPIIYKGEEMSVLRIDFTASMIGKSEKEKKNEFSVEMSFLIRFRIHNVDDLTQEHINSSEETISRYGEKAAVEIAETIMKLAGIRKNTPN